MRYEVSYEINGQSGTQLILADSEASAEEVLQLFRERWAEHGDEFTGSCWINACWSLG